MGSQADMIPIKFNFNSVRAGYTRFYFPKSYSSSAKDIFEVLEEKTEEDIDYDLWLKNTKEALKNSKGKFWLGKSSPFPYNSAFIPKPIISNSSKISIFEQYKKSPNLNDYRGLAQKFKVSVERIKAIIRQKELEAQLSKQGHVINADFVSAIESNLECVETADENHAHRDRPKKLPFRPIFASIPEGESFSFDDAKDVLMASGINIKTPEHGVHNMHTTLKDTDIKPAIFSHSDFEKSRHRFVFVDIGNSEKILKDKIFVRDSNGNLRTPDKSEIEIAVARTWNRNRPQA